MPEMGSLASANDPGDKVDNEGDEEDAVVTDKESLPPSPSMTKLRDGEGEVKSEDFKEGEVEKEVEMVVELDEEVKSEENFKTEDEIKKIDNDEEDEVVDVEGEEDGVEEEIEGNMDDSVNITELPTEGPQETEEGQREEMKDVETESVASDLIEEKVDERDIGNECSLDGSDFSKVNNKIGFEEDAEEKEVEDMDDQQDNQEEGEGDIVEDTDTASTTTNVISSSGKELQCEDDVDAEVVEAMECITNQVASENIQDPATLTTSPVSMETEDGEGDSMPVPVETTIENEKASEPPCSPVPIPDTEVPTPETEIPEVVVPVPEKVPAQEIDIPAPVPPPPVVEVDPEITLLKKEMDRLKAALIWERGSKAELSNKLKKSQEELALKTKDLNVAENKLWERSTAVTTLAERDIELKTLLQKYVNIEVEKSALQKQYDNLKSSLVDVGKEFFGIYATLQNHFKICTVNGPEFLPITPHEALQRRVDDLTTSVHERYKFWNAEQQKMGEELGDTKKTMEELIEFLEVAEEKKPPPPPETMNRATSPIIPPAPANQSRQKHKKKKKEYKCDLCRNSFSNKSILKRHRKSCGDAVAGTSSSSNPNTPAPADNESDSDDIAIIEDAPVSPTPTIVKDSDDDYNSASPNETPSKPSRIPPPLPSPPIVMSKIAKSFAPPPPSIPPPPSPLSKMRRRSSSGVTLVHEVDVKTSSASTVAAKKHTRDITKRELGYFCICGTEFRSKKKLDEHVLLREENLVDKPTPPPPVKKAAKKEETPPPPRSPSPPPPKKKKKKEESKPKKAGHAVDADKENTCTCGRDFINKYHLTTHLEREAKIAAAAATTTEKDAPSPSAKVASKVAAVVLAPAKLEQRPPQDNQKRRTSTSRSQKRRDDDDNDETEDKVEEKTKKRKISVSDDEPDSEPEETTKRSSKRLKEIKTSTPTPAKDETPSPAPRTRRQTGVPVRSPKKANDVPARSPKKSPKKAVKEQDRSSKKVVHEQDHSKSARRGFFCKCGNNYDTRKKLNIHVFCRNNDEKEKEKEESGNQNGNDRVKTFVCGSCGENFGSNAERIKHRVLAHGHGLNS